MYLVHDGTAQTNVGHLGKGRWTSGGEWMRLTLWLTLLVVLVGANLVISPPNTLPKS